MRIIAGKYKGRIVNMPEGVKTRPTQDRVREAIFNIIREVVQDSRVLDLYAGSGALGIEALSRGAKSTVFIDNDASSIRAIRGNIGVVENNSISTEAHKTDAIKAIGKFHKDGIKFDLIFLDPPYYKDVAKNTLIKIDACDILSERSFVIAEHFVKDALPDNLKKLTLFKKSKYGDTVVSFYRRSL